MKKSISSVPKPRILLNILAVIMLLFVTLSNNMLNLVSDARAYVKSEGSWRGYDLPLIVNLNGITNSLGSINPDQIRTEIRNAMNTWNSVGTQFYFIEGSGANIREEVRIVTGTTAQYPQLAGAVAITGFVDDNFNCGGPSTHPLRGACIIINEAVDFRTDCQPFTNSSDLQTSVLHELGHALGLDHTQSYHPEAVMWAYTNLISTSLGCRRQLAQDDINGLISISGLISPLASADIPQLISPANGVTLTTAQTQFDWSDSINAERYFIQVSASNTFLEPVFKGNPIGSSLSFIPGLTSGTTYFWRVKAKGISRNSRWSEIRSFTIGQDTLSKTDFVSFIADITIPNGVVVSPSQALVKTWRVKNIGTSTWNGYKLKFVDGEPMGGPAEIAIPTTAPGQTRDLTINLVAPTGIGLHSGSWQIVNSQGSWVSGGKLWVKINVQSQSSVITLTTDPSSPASAGQVNIYARVNNFPNLRALRILVDGQQLCELGAPEIKDCVWHTNGYAVGQHSIVAEADDWTGTSWDRPQRNTILYMLTGNGVTNRGPYRPTLVANPAYDWYVTIGNAPQLCAQQQGDPEGNPVTQYRFVGSASVGTVDSGWVGGPCHSFGSITPGTYEWHAQVKDSLGGVSDWSDSWHFTVEPPGVDAYIDHFSVGSPSNAEEIKIFACSTGHAGVNTTLRVLVNDANDGTDSGQWNIIKEQGSPCFNDNDAPIWRTLEYEDGPHLVRVVAMAIQPDAGDIYDTVYTLNHRRPNTPRLVAPVPASGNFQEAIYLNSRTVTFKWEPTIRATSYTLHVSTNPSPQADPNPIFRQSFDSSITEHTITLDQDYPSIYWQVEVTNDVGSNASGGQLFGIDQQVPACSVSSLPTTTYSSVFQVNWNSIDNLAGVRTVDIQFMDSERGTWEDWLTSTPFDKTFDLFTGQLGHTYFFRCRATDNANNTGDYPASADTSIIIDPFTRPGTPWWDTAYAEKRNIVMLNNMTSVPLSEGYPIHLRFDNTTTPTAAVLYANSLSTPKCNDLRIIYNDAIELNRIVQQCSSSAIDILFRSQVSITGGNTNNSSHQLYYGNSNAGAPAADPNQVWYPYKEADTTYLYFLQEGSGSTAFDFSGNGRNCSIHSSVQWAQAKFGYGLRFNRANAGDSRSLNCGSAIPLIAFTVEFWYKADSDDGGRIAGELSGGGNGGGGSNWLLQNFEGRIRFDVWPCSSCGSSEVRSNFSLRDAPYAGRWNHIAVSFNGNNEVRFYINGNLDSVKTLSQQGINRFTPPLEIGSAEGISQIKANLGALRISNSVKSNFPYGSFAAITTEPTIATDSVVTPPITGSPDLNILSLATYPNPEGGVLVEAVVENQGNRSTESGFYTDLYLDHIPAGSGDYSSSLRFWVNDPIDPGEAVTLTTVITDLSSLSGAVALDSLSVNEASTFMESSGTLYAQTDSAGLVEEPDNLNNIYSSGVEICTASADSFEDDDAYTSATLISIGSSQTHNSDTPEDQDWIKFSAQAGSTYQLTTSGLGVSSDTYLYLYAVDGTTLITSNDDFNDTLASQIQWTAPQSGTYYILVKHWNPNIGGCGTSYNIGLAEVPPASFGKTSPANGAIDQPTNLNLGWEAGSGAASYEYCIDTTNDGNCNPWVSNGSSTTKNLNNLIAGSTYYWHVRAINSSGITYSNGDSLAFWSFSIVLPTVTPTDTPTNTPPPTDTFTNTPSPTFTQTFTATSIPGNNPLYLSLTANGTVGGVASADEDILLFNGTSWSLFFDGSDVGVGGLDLFAFSLIDADSILMSFNNAITLGGLTIAPQDVVRFDATSLGSVTAGTFSMYLDGNDVGLDVAAEKIDSVTLLSDGRVLVSTTGNPSISGLSGLADEDILAFTPVTLGNNTSGSWALYFDGSDVGLSTTSNEDIDALDVSSNGNIYLSTLGDFAVTGVSGFDEDVFVCAPTSVGSVTACNYSSALYFDGSVFGLSANGVDAINLVSAGVPSTNTPVGVTITPTRTPTSGPSVTPTGTFTPSITPSRTLTPTSTNAGPSSTPTRTFTPSVTPSVTNTSSGSDLIFADSFESGNLSAWTSNTNDVGDLSSSTSAALIGSQGMQAVIDDNNAIYVTDDTPNAEPRYRARFYFDPNSVVTSSSDAHFIFKGFAGTATDVLQVEFRPFSGAYQIRVKVLNDASAFVNTNWFTITDASHFIELDWRAASVAGANNGILTLWIDGAQQADLIGVDNDTRRIDAVRLGSVTGVDNGTRGTYYFDAFESRRLNYIGP